MIEAVAGAGLLGFAVAIEVLFPVMRSVEASEQLEADRVREAEHQERAAQAALRPSRSIEVGPRG